MESLAAHCIPDRDASILQVIVGEFDVGTPDEDFPHVKHEVKSFVVHPHFNSKNLQNDIALLILKDPVKLAAHIGTICLPTLNENFDSRRCTVAGWGKNIYGRKGSYQKKLKKVDLDIVI